MLALHALSLALHALPIAPNACMTVCVYIQDSSHRNSTLKICFKCSSARYASIVPAQDMHQMFQRKICLKAAAYK
ncbi:Uncharacterized protein APZ42_010596 [Daphnia magna]|uniref:Secreted protein n=1 Tax=Daphnia magna TaxID=35525 RepID=A0A164DB81_9CRUS|nr:Uncharacterized protein APZ42_010596 [Daphnia magna]